VVGLEQLWTSWFIWSLVAPLGLVLELLAAPVEDGLLLAGFLLMPPISELATNTRATKTRTVTIKPIGSLGPSFCLASAAFMASSAWACSMVMAGLGVSSVARAPAVGVAWGCGAGDCGAD